MDSYRGVCRAGVPNGSSVLLRVTHSREILPKRVAPYRAFGRRFWLVVGAVAPVERPDPLGQLFRMFGSGLLYLRPLLPAVPGMCFRVTELADGESAATAVAVVIEDKL